MHPMQLVTRHPAASPVAASLRCAITAVVFAAACVAAFPSAASAQELPSLTLTADRTVYTLGEPVELTLRIVNEGDAPIMVRRYEDIRAGMYWPSIAAPGSDQFLRYVGPQYGVKDVHLPQSELRPGEWYAIPMRILHNIDTQHPGELDGFYAFERPGIYRVRVEARGVVPEEILSTDAIEIEMRAPAGEDSRVWRLLQAPEHARFLHGAHTARTPEVAEGMARVLERFPGTVYAREMESSLERQRAVAEPAARAAAEATVQLVTVAGSDVLVQAQALAARAATPSDAGAIIDVVRAWSDAYNAADAATVVQHLARTHALRRRYEQGEKDADRQAAIAEIQESAARSGRVSVDVIGLSIDGDRAVARTVFTAERGQDGTRSVNLVREGSAWRIVEVKS